MPSVFKRLGVNQILLASLFSCGGSGLKGVAQLPARPLSESHDSVDVKPKEDRGCPVARLPARTKSEGQGITDVKPKEDSECPLQADFDQVLHWFQPNLLGRLGRGFEYDFVRVEQPQVLQTATGSIVGNPERYLNEHTLKFQFSELFPSSASLAAAFKSTCAFFTDGKVIPTECQHPDNLNRIVSGGGWWARALSGVTLTADLSERPALQQGVVVTDASFSNHYQVGGSFDFDPAQFFINGSTWSKAAAALSTSCGKTPPGSQKTPACVTPCGKPTSGSQNDWDCFKNLSGPRLLAGKSGLPISSVPSKGTLLLATFLPVVSFKRISQFDFIKNGGILVPTSYLENAQNQFSFKWDLKRSIPSATVRTDVADAYTASRKKSDPTPQPPASVRLCMIAFGNVKSFITVSDTFEAKACKNFAKTSNADHYGLSCVEGSNITPTDAKSIDGEDPVPDKGSCWFSAKRPTGAS